MSIKITIGRGEAVTAPSRMGGRGEGDVTPATWLSPSAPSGGTIIAVAMTECD